MTGQMRIGEVAHKANVPASTIRYYESIGVLRPAERVNGQRNFEPDVLEELEAVSIAQDLGFTLDEVKLLLDSFRSGDGPSVDCRDLITQKLEELDAITRRANRMKGILQHGLNCHCTSIQGCQLFERRHQGSGERDT